MGVDFVMGSAPDRDGGLEQVPAGIGKVKAAGAAVVSIRNNRDETPTFEGFQVGGECGPVHREEAGGIAEARRIRPVQRHHQGILPMTDAEGRESGIEAARKGAGRAVNAEAQAAGVDFVRGAKGKVISHDDKVC